MTDNFEKKVAVDGPVANEGANGLRLSTVVWITNGDDWVIGASGPPIERHLVHDNGPLLNVGHLPFLDCPFRASEYAIHPATGQSGRTTRGN